MAAPSGEYFFGLNFARQIEPAFVIDAIGDAVFPLAHTREGTRSDLDAVGVVGYTEIKLHNSTI